MKKSIAIILLCVFVVFMLLGCTNTEKGDSQEASSSTDKFTVSENSKKSEAASKKVYLEYWIAGDPRRTPVYEDSISDFMDVNPTIEVKVVEEVGNNEQIQQKLMTMISSGSAPGVIHVDTMYVADMARAETIIPLNDFEGAEELKNEVFEGAMEPLIVDNKIYGFPIRANSIQLFYNKRMFREAGLDPEKPPKTFDELVDYAVKLTKKDDAGNILVYGFETGMTKDAHWTAHVFSPLLWTYGGQYQNPDGSSALNSEAAVKALELWKKIMVDLKVSPTERIEKGFVTEKVAMVITGEWEIYSMKNDYPNLDFGVATLPVPAEDVKPIIPLGGRAVVIPRGFKETDAAWKLIQWVMSDEEQMRYTSAEVGLTPKKTLANNPWFDTHLEYKHCLNDMQYVKPKAATNILQMNSILSDAIHDVILNGRDIKEALDEASEKYNKILNNR